MSARVTLRAVEPRDVPIMFAWRDEAASKRHNPLDPLSMPELAARMAEAGVDLADRTRPVYRYMVDVDGAPAGSVALKNVSWRMGYGEVSYLIGEAWHGRGIATRALGLLVDKVFHETDLVRLYAIVSIDNKPSLRVAEKVGFVREGVMREHHLIQGRRVDQVMMGLLRREWSPRT